MATGLSAILAGDVEQVATGFQFTEGPIWHPTGYWAFVDTRPNLIYRMAPGGLPVILRSESGRCNGLTFDLQGRLVMCEGYGRRVSRLEADGSIATIAHSWQGRRLNRPNDVVCRTDGSLYFTDPAMPTETTAWEMGFNGVFRVTPNGSVEAAVQDLPFPNGLAFSPDERILYVANTRESKHVQAFDVDENGALRNPRRFIDMNGVPEEGVPDGMKVDVDGRVYCTGPGGVWVITPNGQALGRIAVPEIPSNCAFGGDDYRTLLITARTSVYAVRLEIAGIAPPGAQTPALSPTG